MNIKQVEQQTQGQGILACSSCQRHKRNDEQFKGRFNITLRAGEIGFLNYYASVHRNFNTIAM